MENTGNKTVIYFSSRKKMKDKSTWSKESMPSDATKQEVAEAARLAGMEGYAIISNFGKPGAQLESLDWFVG